MSAPTERTPLNKPPSPPLAYTYLPEVDDDGREVEVWKPGKSTFNQTVSGAEKERHPPRVASCRSTKYGMLTSYCSTASQHPR